MARLLVSADLSTDRTSATGGCPCFVPGPAIGEITLLGISTTSACRAGVTESLRASGPRKPGKSEGESKISPTDYSLAFPGCKASGLAASPPGQKHHGVKSDSRGPPGLSGNQAGFLLHVISAIEVQEMKSPGAGARGPHRPSPRSVLKRPLLNPTEQLPVKIIFGDLTRVIVLAFGNMQHE